jgi:hypothetical protein
MSYRMTRAEQKRIEEQGGPMEDDLPKRLGYLAVGGAAPLVVSGVLGKQISKSLARQIVNKGDTSAADALIERLQRGDFIKDQRKANNDGIVFVTGKERAAHGKNPNEAKFLQMFGPSLVDARYADALLPEFTHGVRGENASEHVPRGESRYPRYDSNTGAAFNPPKEVPGRILPSKMRDAPKGQYLISHLLDADGKAHSDPSLVLHELGHATGALGRPGKASARWRKAVGYARGGAMPASLLLSGGAAADAANVLTDKQLDDLDKRNAIGAVVGGALHTPLLAEEARASVRAMLMAKKHNIKVSPLMLGKAYGTYLNAAVTPTALSYLATRKLIDRRRQQLRARAAEGGETNEKRAALFTPRHSDLFNEHIPEDVRRELLARRIASAAEREEMGNTVPLASAILGTTVGGLAAGGKDRTLRGSLIGGGIGAAIGGGLGLYRQMKHNRGRQHALAVLQGGDAGVDHELERLRADYIARRRADAHATMAEK